MSRVFVREEALNLLLSGPCGCWLMQHIPDPHPRVLLPCSSGSSGRLSGASAGVAGVTRVLGAAAAAVLPAMAVPGQGGLNVVPSGAPSGLTAVGRCEGLRPP